jgi:hypothetical protein
VRIALAEHIAMVSLPEAVNIHMVPKYIHDGQFIPEETHENGLKMVLGELTRWAAPSTLLPK